MMDEEDSDGEQGESPTRDAATPRFSSRATNHIHHCVNSEELVGAFDITARRKYLGIHETIDVITLTGVQ